MILVDANLLLYAYHPRAEQHEKSRAWLEAVLSGPDLVRFAWLTLWAFLRISTNPRIFPQPLSVRDAFEIMRGWLALPSVVVIQPGARHASLLERLAVENKAGGPLMMDAALAAMALEHGAVLASTDRDFSRFPGIQWVNPIEHST